MTRKEYNNYRYIASELRKHPATYGCQFTINTDGSEDYKKRLDALYTEYNMHPASIRIDTQYFDDKERIIYIYGRSDIHTDYYGRKFGWEELYTVEEKDKFELALTDRWGK